MSVTKAALTLTLITDQHRKKKTMTADFDSNIETGELLMVAHA